MSLFNQILICLVLLTGTSHYSFATGGGDRPPQKRFRLDTNQKSDSAAAAVAAAGVSLEMQAMREISRMSEPTASKLLLAWEAHIEAQASASQEVYDLNLTRLLERTQALPRLRGFLYGVRDSLNALDRDRSEPSHRHSQASVYRLQLLRVSRCFMERLRSLLPERLQAVQCKMTQLQQAGMSQQQQQQQQTCAASCAAELPTSVLTEAQVHRDSECCICLEAFASSEKVKTLPCKHFFHKTCIDSWLQAKNSCPFCRQKAFHRERPKRSQTQIDGDFRAPTATFSFPGVRLSDLLIWAAEENDLDAVGFWCDSGADVNQLCKSRSISTRRGFCFASSQTVSVLHVAVNVQNCEMVKFLLARGAQVNQVTNCGNTPFLIAARVGNFPLLQLLHHHGANPMVRNSKGNTAMHFASSNTHVPMCQFLHSLRVPVDAKNQNGETPALMVGAINGLKTLQLLRAWGANLSIVGGSGDRNLVHRAVIEEKVDWLPLLGECGADFNAMDHEEERCPLDYIITRSPNGPAAFEMVKALHTHGADFDFHSLDAPFLLEAVESTDARICAYVLENLDPERRGSLVNCVCNCISTLAVAVGTNDPERMRMIQAYGGDVNWKGQFGNLVHFAIDPLYLSECYGEIGRMALKALPLLHAWGVGFNEENSKGETPLFLALRVGDDDLKDALDLLHQYGADFNRVNSQGDSLFHVAVRHNSSDEILDCLQKHGVDHQVENNEGKTALGLAIELNNLQATQFFLASQCSQ